LKVKKCKIEFKDVSFHFDKGNKLFQNKNLVIEPGQTLGLVGYSGSGKSTIINLLLRNFEVESGKILIDGQNIQDVTQESLRDNIAFIPQDSSLFHRSILENIHYGNLNATTKEVYEAAEKAHCDFIDYLPGAYDYIVGEKGTKLSGGQRQRISIARAILKDAPILILDEATSALDSQTEKKIQDALEFLMKDKTTLIVAHRLSTLSGVDKIIVFDNGKIVEQGTHKELLKHKGHYYRMWKGQMGGFLPDE
jgi:ATP-binding cassette subfamily B protein